VTQDHWRGGWAPDPPSFLERAVAWFVLVCFAGFFVSLFVATQLL